jgi:hypothetical protein
VLGGIGERLGGRADDAREVAGGVDDRVPGTAAERVQPTVSVSPQLLGLGKELGIGLPAVEQRDVVPACKCGFGDRAPEELRPTDD